jgi:hypothetical protein
MIANLRIVRKALICISLVIALTAELTLGWAAASSQDNGAGLQFAPAAGSAGNATVPNDSGTAIQLGRPSEAGNAAEMGVPATLLGVPVNGTAPLTVGFYVGLTNFPRFTGLSVELRRWRGILTVGRSFHAPRLPASRDLLVRAQPDYFARELDNSFHHDNCPTEPALGEALQ